MKKIGKMRLRLCALGLALCLLAAGSIPAFAEEENVAFAGGVGTLRAWKFALFPQIKLSERMRVFDLGECF